MLAIRLQRRGRKGLAMYRIVVQDSRWSPSKERVVARLGSYNPHTKETTLNKEDSQKFLDNGAQPSPRVVALLKQAGIKMPTWVLETPKKDKGVKNQDKLRKNQPKEEVAAVEEPKTEDSPETSEPEVKAEDFANEKVAEAETKEEVKAEVEPETK